MGKADYLALGDHNAVCYECGMKFKASELRKHWKGYYVCERHWEPRHPQDFVRAVPAEKPPVFVQKPVDIHIEVLNVFVDGGGSTAGIAIAGVAVAGA